MKNLFPFALALLFSACVRPYNISKISPSEGNSIWAWGREFVYQTTDSVVVKIAYETNDRNNVIFNVEIENNSGRSMLIDPEYFWSRMSGANLPKAIIQQHKAIDPESFYLEIAKQRSRQEAEEFNKAINHVSITLPEAPFTTTNNASQKTAEASIEPQQESQNAAYYREVELYSLESKLISLNDRKRFLDQTILRKSTLPPHAVISGEVYFQRHDQADAYELYVPVNGKVLEFRFKQQIVKPKSGKP